MHLVIFTHSLLSDWNHGNAHFLRGVVTDLQAKGHTVDVYEPEQAWSLQNLIKDRGTEPLRELAEHYPSLRSNRVDYATFDLDAALVSADLVLVHEWNDHDLVQRIGEHRKRNHHYHLLFHDTHHRSVTEPGSMAAYELSGYDGVLAFGDVIRDLYLNKGWTQRAWTWHEAADVRVFHPINPPPPLAGDLVWIGNWGDEERTAELHEFLLEPVKALGLKAVVYGVRYPDHALRALEAAGITYGGWMPNYKAPETFAQYRMTVHVPRRPYVEALPGIPTIRPFEALACGIPLLTAPWNDAENLFTPGEDFWVARDGADMQRLMQHVLAQPSAPSRMAQHGLHTIHARHTCGHRVDQLLAIAGELADERRLVTA